MVIRKSIWRLSATSLGDAASSISNAIFGIGILTPPTSWAKDTAGTARNIKSVI
jgi:hypothetical protein